MPRPLTFSRLKMQAHSHARLFYSWLLSIHRLNIALSVCFSFMHPLSLYHFLSAFPWTLYLKHIFLVYHELWVQLVWKISIILSHRSRFRHPSRRWRIKPTVWMIFIFATLTFCLMSKKFSVIRTKRSIFREVLDKDKKIFDDYSFMHPSENHFVLWISMDFFPQRNVYFLGNCSKS